MCFFNTAQCGKNFRTQQERYSQGNSNKMTSIVPIVGINYLKECRIFNMNYLLLSSSLFSLSKAASPDFFLTSVAKKLKLKHKTQAKNSRKKTSTLGRHFPPFKRNSRKKLIFSQKILRTEKISWGTSFYAVFVNKYFQIPPISYIFCQKY